MRPEGWEERLIAAIAAKRAAPWAWGAHDCASFAAACARAVLDEPTPWDRWTGRWSSERGAARLLTRGGGLIAIMDGEAARIDWRMARRGDLVALPGKGGPCLGVVEGCAAWVAAQPGGVTQARLDAALAAWPVG